MPTFGECGRRAGGACNSRLTGASPDIPEEPAYLAQSDPLCANPAAIWLSSRARKPCSPNCSERERVRRRDCTPRPNTAEIVHQPVIGLRRDSRPSIRGTKESALQLNEVRAELKASKRGSPYENQSTALDSLPLA